MLLRLRVHGAGFAGGGAAWGGWGVSGEGYCRWGDVIVGGGVVTTMSSSSSSSMSASMTTMTSVPKERAVKGFEPVDP